MEIVIKYVYVDVIEKHGIHCIDNEDVSECVMLIFILYVEVLYIKIVMQDHTLLNEHVKYENQ
jgi:hypothetical protein